MYEGIQLFCGRGSTLVVTCDGSSTLTDVCSELAELFNLQVVTAVQSLILYHDLRF